MRSRHLLGLGLPRLGLLRLGLLRLGLLRLSLLSLGLLSLGLTSCGYTFGFQPVSRNVRTIAIEVVDNLSFRQGLERDPDP